MKKRVSATVYHGEIIMDDKTVYDAFHGEKESVQNEICNKIHMLTGTFSYTEDSGEFLAVQWKITEISVKVTIDVPESPQDFMLQRGVFIEGFGVDKFTVIKAVRECTAWGLKEAKDLVEAACFTNPVRINDTYGIGFTALRDKLVDAGVPYDRIEIR